MLLNVLDFDASLAKALAEARDGDRIYLPARAPYVAPSDGGWLVNKSLEIFGDGPGSPTSPGTVLVSAGGNGDVLTLQGPAGATDLSNCFIHDLRIAGSESLAETAGRHGISFDGVTGTVPKKLSYCRLERLAITHMGGNGLNLSGSNGTDGAVVDLTIMHCEMRDCAGSGIALNQAYVVVLLGVRCSSNGMEGLRTSFGGVLALYGCIFDGNQQHESVEGERVAEGDLVTREPRAVRLDSCIFRNFYRGPAVNVACYLRDCLGATLVTGCSFELPANHAGGMGISIASPASLGAALIIMTNRFTHVEKAISAVGSAPGSFIGPQYCDPVTTLIELPDVGMNEAPLAIPSVNSAADHAMSGLLVPGLNINPTLHAQSGMLVYHRSPDGSSDELRTNIAGVWKRVNAV